MTSKKWLQDRSHLTPDQMKAELDKLREQAFSKAIEVVCWQLSSLWLAKPTRCQGNLWQERKDGDG